jgi:hypothetical protein
MPMIAFLPPPPVSPESTSSGGRDTWQVLVIVALILGAVVLVAWLLKPLVAKRLRGHEIMAPANSGLSSTRWNETWSRNSDNEEGRDDADNATEPPSLQRIIEPDTPRMEPEETTLLATESAPIAPESPEDAVEEPDVEESETAEIVAITSTVRTLLERANTGRVRDGFALYSEAALQRFRDDMGLSPEEFDAAFDEVPAPPPDQQAELAAITDIEKLPDGRIRALVNYGNGGTYPPPEYFTFVPANGEGWLIDEIAAA